MAIHFRISIKYYTDAGAPKSSLRENAVAPMQVLIPDSLPHYGVAQEKITIVLRIFEKSLVTGSYHAFIVGISHELSHLVLYGTYHSLRFSEEATDITAMVLGYSKYYESGHSTFGSDGLSKLGYLTFEEVMFVAQVIDGTLPHDRESLFDKALTWIKDRIGV
ncbi:MAG TPA: hypothetical protein PK950_03420 [Candidatus Paceibacterota bacterium]|nr:hypothetical protein [Candidatus Paceibacterota bacterium]